MFRSGGAPPPKTHSSYLNRPKPMLQKLAEAANNLSSAPDPEQLSSSEPANNTPRIAVKSSAKGKIPSSTLYPKTDIFFNQTECNEEDQQVQPVRSSGTSGLIGGQDTSDRWTTTLMDASSGKSINQKPPKGVKILSGDKATFLWGDGPPNNYHIRAKPEETGPEDDGDDDATVEPESLTMLKTALINRGAKGILGLSKRFQIMDVS